MHIGDPSGFESCGVSRCELQTYARNGKPEMM
jgi:hypothetical protein